VVQANLLACSAPHVAGHIFNIAGGRRISLNTVIEILQELSPKSLQIRYLSPRPGEVKHSWADISKARTKLGYIPHWDFREGFYQTFRWFDRTYQETIREETLEYVQY